MTIVRLGFASALLAFLAIGASVANAGGYGYEPGYGHEEPPAYCEPPLHTCWPEPPGSWDKCGGPSKQPCATDTTCVMDSGCDPNITSGDCWGTCMPPSHTGCPSGYDCTCVPPGADDAITSVEPQPDCGAHVCLPSRCGSACDCEPGWGCYQGTCTKGHQPSFCCERVDYDTGPGERTCPHREACEFSDGYHGYCPRPDICEVKSRKASYFVEQVVDYFNYCHDASDCVPFSGETSCSWGEPAFVNRKGAKQVEYYLGRIEQLACYDWSHYGCGCEMAPMAKPSSAGKVECLDYRCSACTEYTSPGMGNVRCGRDGEGLKIGTVEGTCTCTDNFVCSEAQPCASSGECSADEVCQAPDSGGCGQVCAPLYGTTGGIPSGVSTDGATTNASP